MLLFKSLENAILQQGDRKAFCIADTYHSYRELAGKISGIRLSLQSLPVAAGAGQTIGLITNDDLVTYASIIAIWLEGKAYTPLSRQTPVERNENMIAQAGITTILDSSEQPLFSNHFTILSDRLLPAPVNLSPIPVSGEELAYTLFTSGTTGIPKGVPITRNNLTAFIHAFFSLQLDLDSNDRWLQMFELTFDLSIFSFLFPLLKGACIYTIPRHQIKYNYVSRLLEQHRLTVALMIPSIIHYLQPYFGEMNYPDLKYNLFCGEALPLDITEKWSRCVPGAVILNVYGPSEATIFCTCYPLRFDSPGKTHNGILSIGKPMEGTRVLLIEHENDVPGREYRPVGQGKIGELCLAGTQLTPGYLNDEIRNRQSFFRLDENGRGQQFYRTGDLCLIDSGNDILYVGRIDSQVKIQGYRVELPEIEFHVRMFLPDTNVIAVPVPNRSKILEIGLLIEGAPFDTSSLTGYLKTKIPSYMIPAQISFEPAFPQNHNGKIDRGELLNKFLVKIAQV